MTDFLKTEIQFLKGVGAARAEMLNKECGIFTFEDLLHYYPYRYVDRSHFDLISHLDATANYVQLKGRITSLQEMVSKNGSRLVATFYDGSGRLELVWFKGIKWLKANIKINEEIVVFGKPTAFNNKINITHPEMDTTANRAQNAPLEAIYSTTEQMRNRRFESKQFRQILQNLLQHEKWDVPEIFDAEFVKSNQLIPRAKAFKYIHHPPSQKHTMAAQRRFKFEELFFLQFPFIRAKLGRVEAKSGIIFKAESPLFQSFI
ncbi:MAG: hypothetical protein RLZZ337_1919, partial [Bacteroidota bacterium]